MWGCPEIDRAGTLKRGYCPSYLDLEKLNGWARLLEFPLAIGLRRRRICVGHAKWRDARRRWPLERSRPVASAPGRWFADPPQELEERFLAAFERARDRRGARRGRVSLRAPAARATASGPRDAAGLPRPQAGRGACPDRRAAARGPARHSAPRAGADAAGRDCAQGRGARDARRRTGAAATDPRKRSSAPCSACSTPASPRPGGETALGPPPRLWWSWSAR